jgi:hypothetical protein
VLPTHPPPSRTGNVRWLSRYSVRGGGWGRRGRARYCEKRCACGRAAAQELHWPPRTESGVQCRNVGLRPRGAGRARLRASGRINAPRPAHGLGRPPRRSRAAAAAKQLAQGANAAAGDALEARRGAALNRRGAGTRRPGAAGIPPGLSPSHGGAAAGRAPAWSPRRRPAGRARASSLSHSSFSQATASAAGRSS